MKMQCYLQSENIIVSYFIKYYYIENYLKLMWIINYMVYILGYGFVQ